MKRCRILSNLKSSLSQYVDHSRNTLSLSQNLISSRQTILLLNILQLINSIIIAVKNIKMTQNIPCEFILKQLFNKLSKSNIFIESTPSINNNPTIKIKPKTLHSLRISNPKKPKVITNNQIFKQSPLKLTFSNKKHPNLSVKQVNHQRKLDKSIISELMSKNKLSQNLNTNLERQYSRFFSKRKTFKKYPRNGLKQTINYHNLSTQHKENQDPSSKEQTTLRSYSAIFKPELKEKNKPNKNKKLQLMETLNQQFGGWQVNYQQDQDLKIANNP